MIKSISNTMCYGLTLFAVPTLIVLVQTGIMSYDDSLLWGCAALLQAFLAAVASIFAE